MKLAPKRNEHGLRTARMMQARALMVANERDRAAGRKQSPSLVGVSVGGAGAWGRCAVGTYAGPDASTNQQDTGRAGKTAAHDGDMARCDGFSTRPASGTAGATERRAHVIAYHSLHLTRLSASYSSKCATRNIYVSRAWRQSAGAELISG